MNDKPILYVDFDGTLVDTNAAITDLYNEDFKFYKNYYPVKAEDIDTYDFEECTCANKDYINTYFNLPRFFEKLQFMPWAETVMYKLSKLYNIKVVSHGYSPNLKQKEIWLKKKLPYTEFIGVNLKEHQDKSHINMKNGIFIDDNMKNLITSNADIKICFGRICNWNKDWTDIRAENWYEVLNLKTLQETRYE